MQPTFDLTGQVAVVTGAGGLLGRQHCAALAEAGASVVAVDLDEVACVRVVTGLPRGEGTEHRAIAVDLTDEDATRHMAGQVLTQYGRVDVLVNNAAINDKVEGASGGPESSTFERYPLAKFREVLDSSVTSAFLCSQRFAPRMAERGCGSIINVASTYALVGPDQRLYQDSEGRQTFYKSAAYPAAKAAMLGLTRFLAAYYGPNHVRANSLSPGGVENGQPEVFIHRYASRTPLARMAAPHDYRGALLFLASDASRYMTGANLVVDGGFTAW